jgi:two-component system response regulator PhoP
MRLLLIEDDAALRLGLARQLEAEGYRVDQAGDGEEGLFLAREYPFDLAIVDLGLPKLNGLTIVQRLRSEGRTLPLLILTARSSWQDKVSGLEAGADDYLVRPFSPAELVARARALLRRARAAAHGGTLRLGDLALDPSGREASRGGRPLELTPREFDLLAHFLRNPDTVLTREHLQAEAWDQPAGSDTNAVDVYVGYLRRKLEAEGGARLIWTVRGVGYVLRESRA